MNLYSKINNYLLRNHPNVWVTRIHLFAPIGVLIFVVLFAVNSFVIGYNPQNRLPDSELSVWLVVIPVIIYLVYWFIFQARYNVEKSGGKLSILQEYLNYFSYYFIVLIAFLIIVVIPISNEYKISKSVGVDELKKDIEVLNLGNAVVNSNNSLSYVDGKYQYRKYDFINQYDYYYYDDYYLSDMDSYDYETQKIILVTENDLYKIIDNYKIAYNKYTNQPITQSAKQIVKDNFNGTLNVIDDYNYWDYYNQVDTKLYRINKLQKRGWTFGMFEKGALYIVGALLALFALFVWIFKQIHWKYYMFGIIALAVTPIVVGIVAVIFFEIFRIDEWFAFAMVIIAYIGFGVLVVLGVGAKEKRPVSIVASMYLQLFLPILPLFIFSVIFYKKMYRSYFPDYEFIFELIYWSGWILGLLSIGAFKLLYKKMSLLPSKK